MSEAASDRVGTLTSLPTWLDDAVVYAIDVPAFRDGNGDGIGDLMGVYDALDDLFDLGVSVFWLLPFYESPRQDNGYDVADHCAVDSRFGSLDDFRRLVDEVHRRGGHLIVDLIANHTSDQHPWFRRAISDASSPEFDYYVWTRHPEREPEMAPVFPGFEDSVWQVVPQVSAWYLHHFYRFEPDLNTGQDTVRESIRKIMAFWLECGVDGFRLDAAPFLGDDLKSGTPDPHAFLQQLRRWLSDVNPDACIVAEADLPVADLPPYFGNNDEVHGLFDFMLNRRIFLALAREDAGPLVQQFRECPPAEPGQGWISFLRHGDEFSLSFLSGEEQDQVFARFASVPSAKVYDRGIRRRLAPMLDNDPALIRLLFSLQFSLPATPMVTYGDEIGLPDNLELPERAAVRTPMQWDEPGATPGIMLIPDIVERNAAPIPVRPFPLPGFAADLRDWLHHLIRCRQHHVAPSRMSFDLFDPGNDAVLGHTYETGSGQLICLHNFSSQPQTCHIPAKSEQVLGSMPRPVGQSGNHCIELEPHGYGWFRVPPGA